MRTRKARHSKEIKKSRLFFDLLLHVLDLIVADELELTARHGGDFLQGNLCFFRCSIGNSVNLRAPAIVLDDFHALETIWGCPVGHEVDHVWLGIEEGESPAIGIVPNRTKGKWRAPNRLGQFFLG